MKCPRCGIETGNKVLESRKVDGEVLRRRDCHGCGKTFVTKEVADLDLRIPMVRRNQPVGERSHGVRVSNNDIFRAWR
jgi:hypothetical protein